MLRTRFKIKTCPTWIKMIRDLQQLYRILRKGSVVVWP